MELGCLHQADGQVVMMPEPRAEYPQQNRCALCSLSGDPFPFPEKCENPSKALLFLSGKWPTGKRLVSIWLMRIFCMRYNLHRESHRSLRCQRSQNVTWTPSSLEKPSPGIFNFLPTCPCLEVHECTHFLWMPYKWPEAWGLQAVKNLFSLSTGGRKHKIKVWVGLCFLWEL